MNIATYLIRFLLAALFLLHGVQKLFTRHNPQDFRDAAMDEPFLNFYALLENTHYLWFVGTSQLLCGALLVFRRTYLLGAVMLVPMLLNLIACHVFLSHHVAYVLFDSVLLLAVGFLLCPDWHRLRATFLPPTPTLF